ncbi:FAD/NAD(P)-binding protein [Pareuzebyella sediminis]|uniref:FAD/NAD(P)-binding protein n=1 Tax=Pareuzebyella sediminis TaxID=2607998 RepID=UPI0011ECC8EE|nr:FAD/NAD(P)-binding protein [Pareuzebyella sediminis]
MVEKDRFKRQYSSDFNVGIIGLGPKGLYALERLLAQIKAKNIHIPIVIHVFNQNSFFGAGNVYRNDQPPYLIMNYANKNIDVWSRELPEAVVPETPSFSEWLYEKNGAPIEHISEGFSSRASVGEYLMESFLKLREFRPVNVQIKMHVTTITKITEREGVFQLYGRKAEDYNSVTFNNLMLTTGHLGSGAKFDVESPSKNLIKFIYPVSQKLKHIRANKNVAVQGMGLTGIDAILALTEGRDGAFKSKVEGSIYYSASGKEPGKIYPFSRSGLPMIPRGNDSEKKSSLPFFTEEVISGLQKRPYLNFLKDVLPLIKEEVTFNYYKVLLKQHNRTFSFSPEFNIINKQIEEFHDTFPSVKRFDWDAFINPFPIQKVLSHNDVFNYVKWLIGEAEKGLDNSPMLAAASTWRQISPVFNGLYSFAGFDAASHRLFNTTYFGLFNRIAYGPPIMNMKKIVALAEAGIVDFSFSRSPKVSLLIEDGFDRYKLGDERKKIEVEYLINARMPRNEFRNENALYANLLQEGLICKYRNNNSGLYTPGCIAIDFKGRALARNGNIQKNITAYGTPTEGVTFDNDTLSRKRNNFASQWAHDISEQLVKIQNNSPLKDEQQHQVQ